MRVLQIYKGNFNDYLTCTIDAQNVLKTDKTAVMIFYGFKFIKQGLCVCVWGGGSSLSSKPPL